MSIIEIGLPEKISRYAQCSTILHSVISTAQANGLDVEKYLTDLFSKPVGTLFLPFNT